MLLPYVCAVVNTDSAKKICILTSIKLKNEIIIIREYYNIPFGFRLFVALFGFRFSIF